ncbi:NAD-P-binding protein [Cytidiella melzeri]|nr:NAD-P-binding protein [Cytidiella melzeri]
MAAAAKTILITGTSSGIGLAAAQLFHSKGWNVVATMRNPAKAPAELKQLAPQERILVTRLDVSDFESIEPAVKEGISKFGKIDVLVNNAGYGQNGLFEAISREKARAQFEVNVFGVMDVTRVILPHFRANKSGGIVNISSGTGSWALPISTMYSASKYALEGFTESLSYECASQNIFRYAAEMPPSTAELGLHDYDEFLKKTSESFKKMIGAAATTSQDVASTIYGAVTDGTDRLRYWIGDDARGFVKAKYGSKNDEEYMTYMRSFFKD